MTSLSSHVKKPVGVKLAGTGYALPANVVTNDDLAKRIDTNDEWITQRTGIRERRIIDNGATIIDLCTEAANQALKNASVAPNEIDLLLVATMTPHMVCPSTAARVVKEIGAVPAAGMDVSAACSGFVYCLNMAASMLQTGFYRNAVVIGAEILSEIVNWEDRGTCILFGDGAGAAVLKSTDDTNVGCLHQTMASDSTGWAELYVPRRDEDVPAGAGYTGKPNTLQMNGREVYKFAVTTLKDTVDRVLTENNLKPSDLAMIVAHQSNARILESARERLGLSEDKLYINIDRFGNTSAASVPICLHELTEAGKLKEGDLVLFVALGGGMTWASSLWRL